MSTVKDEAEIGRPRSESDEESGNERRKDDEEDEFPTSPSGLVPAEGSDEDIYSLNAGNFGSRIRNNHGSTLLRNRNGESSPVLERPSSADGSFSIADDTPSIQAR
jgi:hypothetical protein